MGISVTNVITSIKDVKAIWTVLITHWGMSGPAIFKLSAFAARYLADLNYNFITQINWLGSKGGELRNYFEDLKKQ